MPRLAAFSTSWQMFAVVRFFIGIGCGFYLTVFFTFTVEFISGKYRPMLMAIPSWPLYAAAFGGMSCLIHDNLSSYQSTNKKTSHLYRCNTLCYPF
jgi:OCT family organic cation transporter-like MFS transporter 4/5